VSEATYKRTVERLGVLGAVDLVGILGYYGLISMTIVAFEVPIPGEAPDPFEG
jgi:4-carboxymuconolactone decarboxylase